MRCKHEINGKQCEAHAMEGVDMCYFHNPSTLLERKTAARKGGENRRPRVDIPLCSVRMKTAKDVKRLLGDTINKVRSGILDVRVANSIGILAGSMLRAIEMSDLENRLEIIETWMRKQCKTKGSYYEDKK